MVLFNPRDPLDPELTAMRAENERLQSDRNQWREMWGQADVEISRLRGEIEGWKELFKSYERKSTQEPPVTLKAGTVQAMSEAHRELVAKEVAQERERCAQIAERTYAKDALHFELGTAIAKAIREQ